METNTGVIDKIFLEFIARLKQQPRLSPEEIAAIEALVSERKLDDLAAIQKSLRDGAKSK